ncbi:MAG: RHS repeat-associated core domain-containing protein [Sedimentibacter saalensis]|uniref:RHS repeat-associated core domain-containing protein n=1 Tax=Sedimentibacter saalensis TaxID=130788 RepID=UPI0031584D8B
MVLGVNELGESSAYLYNGLGALVENTWVIKKNAYGYHEVSALTNMVAGEVVVDPQTGKKDKKDKLAPEVVAASPELNKTSTVVKQFVVDYTSDTFEPLMEYEVNSLEYRYVYGNDRLSVNITGVDTSAGNLIEKVNQIRLYYHMDYLGTADYLTSPMTGKVESWTYYNEWGEITHNAVLKCGQRELDLVKRYATHDYDSVLSMYYAKARFYDDEDRRFTAIDPILDGSVYDITDYATDPVQFVQYLYVKNNPVIYIDPDGLRPVIDDLDPYGAYSEKSFDYRYYRQEHKDMFIEGIVSSATAPLHGFDLSQARDYNNYIKKCDKGTDYTKPTILAIDTGDKNVDIAYTIWWDNRPIEEFEGDPRYTAMTVAAFQNKLMRMSSKGINVSKLSVAELNKLFGEEMNSQAEATMAMFGAAVAITKNALGVSNQLTKIKGTSNAVGKGSEVTNLLNNMPELTGSNRDKLLSTTQNSELRKIVDQLYRPGATIGDGGTASKLVQEFYEGSSTHLIKAQERLNQLNNLAKSGNLGFNDLDILEALRNDLNNAINLFK